MGGQRWAAIGAMCVVAGCQTSPATTTIEEPTASTGGELEIEESTDTLAMAAPEADADPLRITFLYSGQGDCIVIQCPNGANIVVDCGSDGYAGTSREQVVADFNALIGPDESISTLVVTHGDEDHYSLLRYVIGDRPIARAMHSLELDRYTGGSDGGFRAWLPAHATEIIAFDGPMYEHEASALFSCGGPTFQIVAVNAPSTGGESLIKNGASIVLRVDYGEFSALLTGDATRETEAAIDEHFTDEELHVDLLKVGHHGSETTSTSARWLEMVRPEVAIISTGHHRRHHHPSCPVVDRVLDLDSTVPDEACHHVTCYPVAATTGCSEIDDEGWCSFTTTEPLYSTYDSGPITVEVDADGAWAMTTERGNCDG